MARKFLDSCSFKKLILPSWTKCMANYEKKNAYYYMTIPNFSFDLNYSVILTPKLRDFVAKNWCQSISRENISFMAVTIFSNPTNTKTYTTQMEMNSAPLNLALHCFTLNSFFLISLFVFLFLSLFVFLFRSFFICFLILLLQLYQNILIKTI